MICISNIIYFIVCPASGHLHVQALYMYTKLDIEKGSFIYIFNVNGVRSNIKCTYRYICSYTYYVVGM